MQNKRALSVAIFSDSALPILNGVSISLDGLMRRLRARGCSVHLFTSAYPGHRDIDPNVHRFLSLRTPMAPHYPLAVPPFYPFVRAFRQQPFDIVHTHTPWTVGFVGLRWAESHGLPVVSTYHTHYEKYAHYIPLLPQPYVRYRIARHTHYYYNQVQAVVTPSQASAAHLGRHQIRTPVHVIPTGIPAARDLSRDQERAALGVDPDSLVLLYVGRLAAEKNMATLIDAMPPVFRRFPQAQLWIVGDGDARPEVRRHIQRLGIGDRVRMWGAISRSDVDRYYAAADLFVFPSLTETQGLVVMEAMSYGLPVVVGNGGGAPEPVEHGQNGWLSPGEPAPFTGRILEALTLRETDFAAWEATQQAARSTALEYSESAQADRVLSLYHQVLSVPAKATQGLAYVR